MNLPRYQVRTLLVATTATALVVACLAPWLRLVPVGFWLFFAESAAYIAVGVVLGVVVIGLSIAITPDPGREYFVGTKTHDDGRGTLAYFGVVYMVAFAFAMQVFALHTKKWGNGFSFSSFYLHSIWLMLGISLVNAARWRALDTQTWSIVDSGFVCWYFLYPWRRVKSYRWIDTSRGVLEIDWGYNHNFHYQFDPADVEAIDALLNEKLAKKSPRNP